jgi:SAM-dependent methyltransferase
MESLETLEQVNREGRERLHPSLTNPSWLVLRKRREIVQKWLGSLDVRDLDVLDVGGRIQPYRALLNGRLRQYVAVDLRRTPLVNAVARGEQIPLASAQFDLVICTQVLQYASEPGAVIAEIYRVLKPGGYLLLSVPAVFPRDADEECWRFLPAGIRQLLGAFGQVKVAPEGGSIAGFFRTTNACLNVFVRYPALRSAFHWILCPVLNLCGALLEKISGSGNDQFAANYSAWAQK